MSHHVPSQFGSKASPPPGPGRGIVSGVFASISETGPSNRSQVGGTDSASHMTGHPSVRRPWARSQPSTSDAASPGHLYGFRLNRRAQDPIAEIHHFTTNSYQWVLEADIEACFDNIDHIALMTVSAHGSKTNAL